VNNKVLMELKRLDKKRRESNTELFALRYANNHKDRYIKKLECKIQRLQAEMYQFVENREQFTSYHDCMYGNSSVLGCRFVVSDHELAAIRANPDILENILTGWTRKAVCDIVCDTGEILY